jgi:hypothetical protein
MLPVSLGIVPKHRIVRRCHDPHGSIALANLFELA